MPHPLNLTLRIKQDAESLQKLAQLKAAFATHIQPAVDKALRESQIVHFARIVVIDDKYFQVLTTYDGDRQEYTEFFRVQLPEVFRAVFELAEGAPPWSELNNPDAFYRFAKTANVRALGSGDDAEDGYLFSATGNATVKRILEKLG
jgi:hypothetical protein